MTPRLRRQDDKIFFDIWKNVPSADLRSTQIIETVKEEIAQAGLDISTIDQYKWCFDLKPEGINAQDMQTIFEWLCNIQKLPVKNFRVAYSCIENVDNLAYPAVCIPDRLIHNGNWYMHLQHYHVNWANLPMTHKLVCLMRRPSIGRGNLAKRLLAKFGPDEMIMTFGTNGVEPGPDIKRLIWPQPYPMIVDRPMADQVFQHRIDHDFFYRAPVKVIVESSSQIDPNTWRSIFITEKTFKAMAWHQFPIWYAVPGLVDQVRQMGFDVFDDLFDQHRYDSISDPWVRMTQVVQTVVKFCSLDTVALRHQHWQRLESNANLVDHIHTTSMSRHTQILEELWNA